MIMRRGIVFIMEYISPFFYNGMGLNNLLYITFNKFDTALNFTMF